MKAAGFSRCSAEGMKSGWSHTWSRSVTPTAMVERRHSSAAASTLGRPNSMPTTLANAFSAEPPELRRFCQARAIAGVEGIRVLKASLTTYSTQPSTSASRVSRRVTAAALRSNTFFCCFVQLRIAITVVWLVYQDVLDISSVFLKFCESLRFHAHYLQWVTSR